MNHIGCITTERAHLVALSTALANALSASYIYENFPDPARPMTIAVNGTKTGGKKIIPDVFVETLFDTQPVMNGRYDWDEIHTGIVDARSFQSSFINVAWNENYHSGYGNPCFDRPHTNSSLIRQFHASRGYPGISFVHNANHRIKNKTAIEIWLESRFGDVVGSLGNFMPVGRRMSYQAPPLRQHFADATTHNGWVRWCEIKINDQRLLNHTQMRDFMNAHNLPDTIAVLNRSWFNRLAEGSMWQKQPTGTIPQYGVNLPRP